MRKYGQLGARVPRENNNPPSPATMAQMQGICLGTDVSQVEQAVRVICDLPSFKTVCRSSFESKCREVKAVQLLPREFKPILADTCRLRGKRETTLQVTC